MHRLLEHLSHILVGEQERLLELRELKIEFVKKENDIFNQVQLCHKSGGVIGIYSDTLGKGMFLVTVQRILQDQTLVLRQIDGEGRTSSKILLDIGEISSVCPFNQIYQNAEAHNERNEVIPSQLSIFQRN